MNTICWGRGVHYYQWNHLVGMLLLWLDLVHLCFVAVQFLKFGSLTQFVFSLECVSFGSVSITVDVLCFRLEKVSLHLWLFFLHLLKDLWYFLGTTMLSGIVRWRVSCSIFSWFLQVFFWCIFYISRQQVSCIIC